MAEKPFFTWFIYYLVWQKVRPYKGVVMSILRKKLKDVDLKNVVSVYSENHIPFTEDYIGNLKDYKFSDLVHWEGPKNYVLNTKGYYYTEKEGRGGPQHGKRYIILRLKESPLRVELVRIQNRDSTIRAFEEVLDTKVY